jgi:iron complex outermembrane recepter protein
MKLARALLVLAVASTAFSTAALAQSAAAGASDSAQPAGASTSVAEIVVTAQRRSERLQDVPIAISALSGHDLTRENVGDVRDLRGDVPSLSITGSSGLASGVIFSIRGVSGQVVPFGASQATAVYLDGIYLARPEAALFDFDDLERIEVLRGPQGTLYGQNATAGAINIITTNPDQTFRGSSTISYGDYNTVSVKDSMSGPIANHLAAGISLSYDRHDGYFLNTFDGKPIGDQDSATGRVKLRYDSDDGLDALLSADYSRVRASTIYKNLSVGSTFVGMGDPNVVANNVTDNETNTDTGGVSLTVNDSVTDQIKITSISSWRTMTYYNNYDLDGSAAALLSARSNSEIDTISQELRAVYTGERLRWTAGANYYREYGYFELEVNPADPGILQPDPYAHSNLNTYAAFGQVEYDILPNLTLVGGLRDNNETREFSIDYTKATPPGLFTSGGLSAHAVLPAAGINFKPARDVLIYAKYSQGYQAPGFNATPGPLASTNTFGAERLDAYETGLKTQFFDRRLTFNLAGFFYNYKDIQVREQIAPGVVQIVNAADATVKGAEVEVSLRPIQELTLSGHVTGLDATYNHFCDSITAANPQANDPLCSPGFANRAGNSLNNAPRWSGGVSANYNYLVNDSLTIATSANYSFESGVYFTPANELPQNDGWRRLDARVTFQRSNGVDFFVYGKNLTDYRYLDLVSRQSATLLIGVINDPRTYGVGASYKF